MISQALAAHFAPPTGSAGGGFALLIIIGGAIAFYLVYRSQKKWRKRKLRHDGGDE